MRMWSLRWHFTNMSVTRAPYSIKSDSTIRKPRICFMYSIWKYTLYGRLHCSRQNGNVAEHIVGTGKSEYSTRSQDYVCRSIWSFCSCLSHTHTHPFNGTFPGLPRWAGTRKVKPIWILLKQETMSGSGISWASFFTGRMPFLPSNQQRQSTESTVVFHVKFFFMFLCFTDCLCGCLILK